MEDDLFDDLRDLNTGISFVSQSYLSKAHSLVTLLRVQVTVGNFRARNSSSRYFDSQFFPTKERI